MDRGKQGIKRSTAVDARGIPIGTISAPANRHDSPLLIETLDAVAEVLGELPEGASVHLDRGYDSKVTRERLRERGLLAEISEKGKPAPMSATKRWVVEETSPITLDSVGILVKTVRPLPNRRPSGLQAASILALSSSKPALP